MKIDHQPVLRSSSYDKSKCKAGIVHFGYGAFHRAHQAWYIDQYMDKTGDLDWGIVAVNLRAADSAAFGASTKREDGYVLKTISPSGVEQFELVRSHVGFQDWSNGADEHFELIADSNVKILSMTVTESGYCLNSSGRLDVGSKSIVEEMAGGKPDTIYGFLRKGLLRRMAGGSDPITLLCCDNIRHNGTMLETNLRLYLEATGDDELLDWLGNHASFPCSMVDRITPKPTNTLVEETRTLFKREDDASVMGEDFIQWVIEDRFAARFPELGKVGVTITRDVTPYEETKIRVLNGGHTCLVYLGALKGHGYYHDLLKDSELLDHYTRFETLEVLPALPADLPFDKTAYYETVSNRFGNAHIADSVERICMDGYNKFPIFIRPTIRRCFELGIPPVFAIRSIASWYVFARNIEHKSLTFNYYEPYMKELLPMLSPEGLDAFVNSSDLWSDLPKTYPQFVEILKSEIKSLGERWPV